MPKNGVPQSRSRRDAERAREEAVSPSASGRNRSVLAEFLRDPTSHKERELVRAASNGELTAHDLQAAFAAQIIGARKLLSGRGRQKQKPEDIRADAARRETDRASHVLLKQLIEGLKGIVMESTSGGGPSVVVELHWPDEFAGADRGEDVRVRVPPEQEGDGS